MPKPEASKPSAGTSPPASDSPHRLTEADKAHLRETMPALLRLVASPQAATPVPPPGD